MNSPPTAPSTEQVDALVVSDRSDPRLTARMARVQRVALVAAATVAVVILSAWLVPALGGLLPTGWSLMKANTTVGVLLGGAGVALLRGRRTAWREIVAWVLSVALVVLAGNALLGHLGGPTLPIETLVSPDHGADMPGRMSAQTASFLSLFGMVLLLDTARSRALGRITDATVLLLVSLVMVVSAGYSFGAVHLFGQSEMTRTSPQTLACMILLTFALVVSRSRTGLFSILVGIGIGSHIVRAGLPVALLVPFVVIGLGARAFFTGMVSAPSAAAAATVFVSLLLFAVMVIMARRINGLERQLRELSLTDELTGIFNQRGFTLIGEHAYAEQRRAGESLTVLFFDLDGLKDVNDTLGHEIGSDLIAAFASLLRETFRASDVVARVGGDEFAVAMRGRASVPTTLDRLERAADAANARDGIPYQISYSVGVATGGPDGGESFSEVVDRADATMYERKRLKKATAHLPPPATPPVETATPLVATDRLRGDATG
jgi:diguanylate cyclase (GGDEF)-like protein